MDSGNTILGNQLVVMSRADLDALVEKMASNLVANKVQYCINNEDSPKEKEEERSLTRKEVAKLLHVDLSTLWRWNRDKVLCCKKVGPRRVVYLYIDVIKKLNGEG